MYITQSIVTQIKQCLNEKNISVKTMLSDLGMGINALSEFAKGKELSCIKLAKIADYLDCSVDYLLGRTDVPEVNYGTTAEPEPKTRIKYFSQPVCAGYGNYITDCDSEWLELSNVPSKADYIVKVQGDSMEPEFYDGDLVYVKETTDLHYGDVGIFTVDSETMIKKCTHDGLEPLNPKYDIVKTPNGYTPQGKVIGKVEE